MLLLPAQLRQKNKAKTRPGKTSVTTGVRIGGKNDAVINLNI
jgi:hypothetical protein